MNYLDVDIYREFKCIADACPNTCCVGWEVFIDKNTYKKMAEKEEQLGIPAKEWLKDNGEIVSVRLDHERCPMLADNNLCNVVMKLGPEYLSSVCTIYPRAYASYGDTIERHLQISCPEVIMKLMEKHTIEFDACHDQSPAPEYPYTQLYLFECDVRAFIIGIIQDMPQITLNTRLFTAYTILEEGIRMYQENQLDSGKLEKEVSFYAGESVLRNVETQLTQVVNGSSQYRFAEQLLKIADSYNQRYVRLFRLVRQAMAYFEEHDIGQYMSDAQEFKKACLDTYPDFYTNYWVYRIFADTLSVPDYEKSKEKFSYIAIEFALFQTIAMAAFAKRGSLDHEEYIYIISTISRILEHTENFRNVLMNEIHEKKLASAAGILLMALI